MDIQEFWAKARLYMPNLDGRRSCSNGVLDGLAWEKLSDEEKVQVQGLMDGTWPEDDLPEVTKTPPMPPCKPPKSEHEPVRINLGFGKIGVHDGHIGGVPALILTTLGTGKIGEAIEGERQLTDGEEIASIVFYNVASLDVVLDHLALVRQKLISN